MLFVAGKSENMDVQLIQTSLSSHIPENYDYQDATLELDLDQDNFSDLRFTSVSDSINSPDDFLFRLLRVEVINDNFELASYSGGTFLYEQNSVQHDYYGTFPRKTYYHQYSCLPQTGYGENIWGSGYDQLNITRFFEYDEKIKLDELHWGSEYNVYNMTMTPYEESYYNFTIGGDSLHGHHFVYPSYCETPANNEPNYLVFKKDFGGNLSYGWIKIYITGFNQLEIESIGMLIN